MQAGTFAIVESRRAKYGPNCELRLQKSRMVVIWVSWSFGAGPVGLFAALQLCSANFPVTTIESPEFQQHIR